MKVGCIVLAGGKSSRLGRDKASVELGGLTLLQRCVSNLEFLDSDIVVVAAPEQSLPSLRSKSRLKIVRDIASDKGPLVGIYTGLRNMEDDYGFVVACDMPFVKPALVWAMTDIMRGYDVVIPRQAKGLEPLHSIYSRSCVGSIETLMGLNRYKIDRLLDMLKVRYFEKEEVNRVDPEGISFFNVNTIADLAKAREVLEEAK